MVEENPLQVIPSSASYTSNKKGRPRKGNIIKFSPQPQSMVSKLMTVNKTNHVHDSEIKCFSDNELDHSESTDHINHISTQMTSERVLIGSTNKKGRPIKGNIIKFSPQPQSIISKLLSKAKDNSITPETVENQLSNEDSNSISEPATPISIEPEYIVDDDYPDHKRQKQSEEVNEPSKPELYSCDFENCTYFTKLSSNMTKHKRVHTGEKPYLCDRCSFRSNFINSLKSHKRLHTEERPYKCTECSYSCNSISNLKKHNHTRHKNVADGKGLA